MFFVADKWWKIPWNYSILFVQQRPDVAFTLYWHIIYKHILHMNWRLKRMLEYKPQKWRGRRDKATVNACRYRRQRGSPSSSFTYLSERTENEDLMIQILSDVMVRKWTRGSWDRLWLKCWHFQIMTNSSFLKPKGGTGTAICHLISNTYLLCAITQKIVFIDWEKKLSQSMDESTVWAN